jgi:hypothetical protein
MAAASAAHRAARTLAEMGHAAFGRSGGTTFALQHQDFDFDVRALALTA